MNDKRVILVTGVAGYWGSQVAARLLAASGDHQANLHVMGLDTEPPSEDLNGLDFIQADIRNPLLMGLFKSENVDTVIHLVFHNDVHPSEAAFDVNVIGSMKVIGACAEAGVHKVILKSSTAVYGALPTNAAFLTEDHPLNGSRAYGYTRDMIEVEAFCNGFRRQVPEMGMTILRFPSIVGPKVDTPMTRFLCNPLAPVLLGFEPVMQIVHERDVVEALVHAAFSDVPGVFNVAAEGVLPLYKLIRLAGKQPIPMLHPLAYWGATVLGGTGLRVTRYVPIELDYIRYPWVADLAKMRAEFGFTPHYTIEETLREFAGQQRLRRYVPESAALAYDEERLRDTIERRRRIRQQREHTQTGSIEEGENEY